MRSCASSFARTGCGAIGREDVDHLAQDEQLARFVGAVVSGVPGAMGEGGQRAAIQALARPQREDSLVQRLGGGQALDQSLRRGDQHAGARRRLAHPQQRRHAAAHHFARRRSAIVRQAVPCREQHGLHRAVREGLQRAGDLLGAALPAGDVEQLRRAPGQRLQHARGHRGGGHVLRGRRILRGRRRAGWLKARRRGGVGWAHARASTATDAEGSTAARVRVAFQPPPSGAAPAGAKASAASRATNRRRAASAVDCRHAGKRDLAWI